MSSGSMQRPTPIYTPEKAVRLFKVFIAVISIMLLLGWQEIIVLNPLKRGKAEMEHMDPSEIVATPFPLQNVVSFTMFPVVVSLIFSLVRSPNKFTAYLVSLVKLTLVTFALFSLCGDNMVKHWQSSILTALYIGTLAASTSNGEVTSNIMKELPFSDFSDPLAVCRLYGMLIFIIPFQVLTVLDHGLQIQRWPLPVLLGGTYGYVVGTMIGIFLLSMQKKSGASKGE